MQVILKPTEVYFARVHLIPITLPARGPIRYWGVAEFIEAYRTFWRTIVSSNTTVLTTQVSVVCVLSKSVMHGKKI